MSDVTSAPVSSPAGARCAFCKHVNPAGSKYCNECAADLQLTLCEECSAINKSGMLHCHKCGAALTGQEREPEPEPHVTSSPASEASLPRRPRPFVALLAVLVAAFVTALYFTDRAPYTPPSTENHPAETLPATAANSGMPDESAPRDEPEVAKPDAAPPTGDPLEPIEPLQPEQAPPSQESAPSCTDAAAALALCDRSRPNEGK